MQHLLRRLVAQNALITSRLNALEALIAHGALGDDVDVIADPAPDGGGPIPGGRIPGGRIPGGFGPDIGPVADPAPFELERLSKVQLESRLADIEFTRKKLDSLEGMLKEQLDRVR